MKNKCRTLSLLLYSIALLLLDFNFIPPKLSLASLSQTQTRSGLTAYQLVTQGREYYDSGHWTQAIETFQEALILYENNNVHAYSVVLSMMASAHLQLDNYAEAIQLTTSAIELSEGIQDVFLKIKLLGNLGIAHKSLGQYLSALEYYQRALRIAKENERSRQESHLFSLIGNIYSALGDYDHAIVSQKNSLEIAERENYYTIQIRTLGNLGSVYSQKGQYDLAMESYESSLHVAKSIKDLEGVARALNNIGTIYHAQNDSLGAINHYRQSLETAREINLYQIEYEALSNLGLAYEDLEDYDQAILYYEQGLEKARESNIPRAVATAENNLGHGLLNSGHFIEAERHLRAAIDHLESLRPTFNDTYNISLFDTQIFTYSLLQQILIAQNKHEAALEISERGRAQAFVDLLAQRTTPERIENISNLDRQPLTIEEIKTIAREQNATLVEYALVPDDDFKFQGRQKGPSSKIFIWVVKPTGEIIFKEVDLTELLPTNTPLTELVFATRKVIDAQGEGRGTDTERSAENCHIDFDICLGDKVYRNPTGDGYEDKKQYEVIDIDPEEKTVTLYRPDTYIPKPEVLVSSVRKVEDPEEWHSRLNQLHQILIEPIKNELPTNPEERVIFIPQEELFLVPFPALQDKFDDYLIQQHTISTVPSIQVLANTRQRRLDLANSTGDALIVGNPSPMPSLKTDFSTARPSDRSEETQILPLPHSATEANEIAQLLQTEALVESAATEAVVKQRLSNARLIHLATHGFFKENGDALQSSLALATHSENQDGFLTAEEILAYDLQADLVVLSACDTGRGQLTGDGVIGLSRSFIAAGTPSVIVSLWHVPDEATSELMLQFYQNHQTLDKAQSLRQAMLHMIEKEGSEPKDWAAFTLIGEAE